LSVAGPAPLFRLKARERAQVLLRAELRDALVRVVRDAVEGVSGGRGVREVAFSVDIDPQ
jgi:primosomal protein N' (replication factor Y)